MREKETAINSQIVNRLEKVTIEDFVKKSYKFLNTFSAKYFHQWSRKTN